MIVNILDKIDSVMYYPVLIIILVFGGLYFTILTRFVQIRPWASSMSSSPWSSQTLDSAIPPDLYRTLYRRFTGITCQ